MPQVWDAEHVAEAKRKFVDALKRNMKTSEAAKEAGHSLNFFKAWATVDVDFAEAWNAAARPDNWRKKIWTR